MRIEDKEIIAEFIGRKGRLNLYTFEGLEDLSPNTWYDLRYSQFHKDWNWLMIVVRKIVADFEFNEEMGDNQYRDNLMDIVPFGVIEDVCEAVLNYIKWYNQQIK